MNNKLCVGTMRSAKSANLIMRAFTLKSQGKTVVLLKPSKDTRNEGVIHSRALNTSMPCHLINDGNFFDIMKEYLFDKNASSIDTIFIDEVQFLDLSDLKDIVSIANTLDINICAYGLMIDFKGNMFDSVKKLLECGFDLENISMPCDNKNCSNDSSHHLLYINGELQKSGVSIQIEEGERTYKSVCFPCFVAEMSQ